MDRALAFDPAMRFQSAHEMLAELEEYALATQLMASQLRFAAFLSLHFEPAFAELRLLREQAADYAISAWHSDPTDAGESGSRPLPKPPEHVEPAQLPPAPPVTPYVDLSGSDDDLGNGAFRAKGIRPLHIAIVVIITAALAYWLATH
jgi:hypothetical protein